MESVAQSQIFFIITSVAVVVITILIIVLLVYVIKIVRKLWRVSDEYGNEALEIKNSITRARKKVAGIFTKKEKKS